MTKIKLLLVDDHEIVRAGLRMLFMAEPGVEIVGEASNGAEALAAVARCRPDIVLMDAAMPDMNGMEATRRIKEAFPDVAVLALTMHEDERYFFAMLDAGASGYVPKRAAPDELMSAIQTVSQGDVFIHPSLARLLVNDFLQRSAAGRGDSRAPGPQRQDRGPAPREHHAQAQPAHARGVDALRDGEGGGVRHPAPLTHNQDG